MSSPLNDAHLKPGALVAGKYRLRRPIGEGAMGVVWAAVNESTSRELALKLVVQQDRDLRARLLQEAHACGQLKHRNIVQVYNVDQTERGEPFLVMPLLSGETLAALLTRRRRLDAGEAARIGRDISRGLAAAHAMQIVHRDLKPSNVFLHTEPDEEESTVKLLDFGISKVASAGRVIKTATGIILGSPSYMSPEQVRSLPDIDSRSDIWSLGVVLYEMLAGVRPFQGTLEAILRNILVGEIPAVSQAVRNLDPRLAHIVSACLQRDRHQRPAAAEIAGWLDAFATPEATPYSPNAAGPQPPFGGGALPPGAGGSQPRPSAQQSSPPPRGALPPRAGGSQPRPSAQQSSPPPRGALPPRAGGSQPPRPISSPAPPQGAPAPPHERPRLAPIAGSTAPQGGMPWAGGHMAMQPSRGPYLVEPAAKLSWDSELQETTTLPLRRSGPPEHSPSAPQRSAVDLASQPRPRRAVPMVLAGVVVSGVVLLGAAGAVFLLHFSDGSLGPPTPAESAAATSASAQVPGAARAPSSAAPVETPAPAGVGEDAGAMPPQNPPSASAQPIADGASLSEEERAPPPASTSMASPAPSPPPPRPGLPAREFDQSAARAALTKAAAEANACKGPGGPTGSGKAHVLFGRDGATLSVVLEGPIGATSIAGCILSAFRRARVPAFTGAQKSVVRSFTIR